MRFFRKLGLSIAVLAFCAAPALARNLVGKVVELDAMPPPTASSIAPNDPNQLFYLQRSSNSNTIVYAANLTKPGQIDRNNPLDIFWRRYTEDGRREGLSFMQRTLAYGSSPKAVVGHPDEFDASVVSLPELKFHIAINAEGNPEATVQMGGRLARLVSAYVKVDESGLIPKLVFLDIYGIDKATGRVLHQHLEPG